MSAHPPAPHAPARPPVVVVPQVDCDVPVPRGWTARLGFSLPDDPLDLSARRWVCVGEIHGPGDMRDAVAALDRGVGLVVAVAVTGSRRLDLLEDLDRAGQRFDQAAHVLDEDQRLLLTLLAEGLTVATAARQASLSVRTAHRRIADARRRLGVETTTAAVLLRDQKGDVTNGGS